ncbi:MAG: Crp/Fnr family transcriptional regulator [Desulfovibrionaceae bacterium]|nr:Crp/Fnr family transcriptional regulator [Desulfovibrionaceae bacterium]
MRIIDCQPQARLMQLKRTKVFDGVDDSTLLHLVSTADLGEIQSQELLAQEGDEASFFFVIIRGLVKVIHRQSSGKEHIIHIVSDGSTIGESCMFRQKHWPATAQALEQCLVLRIQRKNLHEAVQGDAGLGVCLLGILALRNRMCIKKLSMQGVTASQRISRYILHRVFIEDSTSVILKVSRAEMANMLGVTRETLSRVLSRFVSDHLITLHGRQVTVLDTEKLQIIAGQK